MDEVTIEKERDGARRTVAAKIVIRGRAKYTRREPLTLRLRRDLIDEIARLVEAPQYLAYEFVLRCGLEMIRSRKRTEFVDAAVLDGADARSPLGR